MASGDQHVIVVGFGRIGQNLALFLKEEAIPYVALDVDPAEALVLYLGDDETDEDAFRALADVGVGVLVSDEPRRTAASYRLRDTEETRRFLARLAAGAEA
mgnify:CR=1 FL=1